MPGGGLTTKPAEWEGLLMASLREPGGGEVGKIRCITERQVPALQVGAAGRMLQGAVQRSGIRHLVTPGICGQERTQAVAG